MSWTFAVLGPGGVGGLIGALLARRSHRVICLAGEQTADALRDRGLHVRSATFGDFQVPVEAATELAEPVDACLVTVKAPQLDAALRRVPPAVLGQSLIVPFLNGVEHVADLRARYPAARVLAATLRIETFRVAPGEIEHRSPFAVVELVGAPELAQQLRAAGLEVTEADSEAAVMWGKVSVLAPLALLTTHTASPVGDVRTRHRDDLLAVVGEVTSVARAQGADIDAQAITEIIDSVPAGMKTSMQRDSEAGLETEVEAIGGDVLRAAERAGIDIPVTTRLVDDLRRRLS